MIDRARFVGCDFVAPHASREMAGEGSQGRLAAGLITMLKISDHERRRACQGDFKGKRKLGISDSVLHDRMRTKLEH